MSDGATDPRNAQRHGRLLLGNGAAASELPVAERETAAFPTFAKCVRIIAIFAWALPPWAIILGRISLHIGKNTEC
jgi:hypothetical protein